MTAEYGRGSDPERDTDGFPWLVTLGAICVGLVVYFHSTQAAVAERQLLEAHERALEAELERLHHDADAAAAYRQRLAEDPETILVELDSRGISPERAHEASSK